MANYDGKTIKDYILGNDISGYDIDELENDVLFMTRVINYTNDKNIYYLCGDNVKRDSKFIKFLIKKFKNDLDFITMVANNYINLIDDNSDTSVIEINILISKYYQNSTANQMVVFNSRVNSFWIKNKMMCEKYKKNNAFRNKDVQMGFDFILREYKNSKIIKDFLAEKFLYDIFINEDYSNIQSEMLISDEFNNYIFNIINKYDTNLCQYIKNDISLDYHIKYIKDIIYQNIIKKKYTK